MAELRTKGHLPAYMLNSLVTMPTAKGGPDVLSVRTIHVKSGAIGKRIASSSRVMMKRNGSILEHSSLRQWIGSGKMEIATVTIHRHLQTVGITILRSDEEVSISKEGLKTVAVVLINHLPEPSKPK